jgi:DNA-binding NtrC family response regulator
MMNAQVYYEERRPVLTISPAALRVVSGPDRGASVTVEHRRVVVGTAADCDLVLTDLRVSDHHLEAWTLDDGLLVRDLHSSAGTRCGAVRVHEALLGAGEEIWIAGTALQLELEPPRQRSVAARERWGELIGSGAAMESLFGLLTFLADGDRSLLLEGESGTGRERLALEVHRTSPRREGVFCAVDCGALPAPLLELQLFGHERGAFAGAVDERKGAVERANYGTLFCDEIGELPLALQERLLEVMRRRAARRVGGERTRPVSLRLLASTSRDLTAAIEQGTFRRDLLDRLTLRVVVPPLRERREDILPLARHFLWEAGGVDPDLTLTSEVVDGLTQRMWPGNVRELCSLMHAAVPGAESSARCAPPPEDDLSWLASALPPHLLRAPYKQAKESVVRAFETLYTRALVGRHGSSISAMAREAGVDRQLVRKLLKAYGCEQGDD